MIILKNYLEYTAIIHLPDRVPISILSFQNAVRLAGMTVREYCQSGECMAEVQLAYWETFRHDIIDIENGIVAMAEAVGCRVEYPELEPPWVVESALQDLNELCIRGESDQGPFSLAAEILSAE